MRIYLLAILFLPTATIADDAWTQLGGNARHVGSAARGPSDLQHPRWTFALDPNETFVDQASPIVADGKVFVATRRTQGFSRIGNRLRALSVVDGQPVWQADLPNDALDSWSSPAFDAASQTVLVTSANRLYAVRVSDGVVAWETQLRNNVVNASPVITEDSPTQRRILLTDFDGTGSSASLYCINASERSLPDNPFDPGQIVWRLPIGTASGATPAYDNGRAYLASGPGQVLAVDVRNPPLDPNDANRPLPAWDMQVATARTPNEGFYGGISLADDRLLCAQYEFNGGANSARLFALAAADGGLLWQTACERTSSIPLPLGDDVLLSAGIVGFGSQPKTQRFAPDGNSATLTWEATASSSVGVGGYTHHPVRIGNRLFTGTPSPGLFFGPHTDLYVLDLDRDPNDSAFVVDTFAGAGGSPAVAYGRLFSIGEGGLTAFDPSPPCAADGDASGNVDLSDLARLLAAFGATRGSSTFDVAADVNLDDNVDLADLASLLAVFGEVCP